MASAPDVVAELQAMIDEILDLVLEVKQAHHAVPEARPLHHQLDALFADLAGWTQALADRTRALGGSLLQGGITTVAGRHARNLFPAAVADAEVAAVLTAPLQAAAGHARVHQAGVEAVDAGAAALLDQVASGLSAHVERLETVGR